MCGSLRLENQDKTIGDLVTYTRDTGSEDTAPWYGFHRSEKPIDLSFQEEVTIAATHYTEKGIEFSIPPSYKISAVLTKRENIKPNGRGLFIQTRPATREELDRCKHPRHPLLRKGRDIPTL